MTSLELLAPARTTDIGIAAIDCGADAVYIAGPEFGARHAAANSVDDIHRLCSYADLFGVRIFVTLNTILYDGELAEAERLLRELEDAGADGFIVQDPAVLELSSRAGIRVPLHASTQCSIRTPERAAFLEGLGYARLVLERQLSLAQIRSIRSAVSAELECFVHGALCVCYSGECYLSELLSGRSANRGACVQACRSRYDLVDRSGRVLVKDKALLSLKDLNLLPRLRDLAGEGVCSFKIEGRLKGASYVKNVVRAYSEALDALVAEEPGRYRRASCGRVRGGFTPKLDSTFNRGYTTLYIDGKRGRWASMDAPKSMGEPVGRVRSIAPGKDVGMEIGLDLAAGVVLRNGDGFSFSGPEGVTGFRGDVCSGGRISSRTAVRLKVGTLLYRNISAAFERELSASPCVRELPVAVRLSFAEGTASARSEDGREVSLPLRTGAVLSENRDRQLSMLRSQLSKRCGRYIFSLEAMDAPKELPLMSSAELNGLRRSLAAALDMEPCRRIPLAEGRKAPVKAPGKVSYKHNVANSLARNFYMEHGAQTVEPAYETGHQDGAELMRSRYCIRHETGLCPVHQGARDAGPLYLRNNGRLLALGFDCNRCEMTVRRA